MDQAEEQLNYVQDVTGRSKQLGALKGVLRESQRWGVYGELGVKWRIGGQDKNKREIRLGNYIKVNFIMTVLSSVYKSTILKRSWGS